MNIKEIRNTTGLSQRSFSKMFNIPISTLQKWEQGESSPTPYIIKLIANQLPIDNDNMLKIEDLYKTVRDIFAIQHALGYLN